MATVSTSSAPEVKIGDWIKEGWEVFVSDAGIFILASLIFNVILMTGIGGLIFFGPLMCGFYLMIFDRMKGEKADIKRLFAGFDYFGQALMAGAIFFILAIVGMIITVLGLLACIVPSLIGIALMVVLLAAFMFPFQLIVQRGVGAMEAISLSFGKVRENLWQFLLFALVIYAITMAGGMTGVGWLITTPLTLAATAVAYRDVFGLEGGSEAEEKPAGV